MLKEGWLICMRRLSGAAGRALFCWLFLTLPFFLAGCSVSGALKGAFAGYEAGQTYDLVLDQSRIKRTSRVDTQLVVTTPMSVKVLGGENILVKPSANKVTYYGRAVWSDRLPKLLQARIIEAMVLTGRFRDVSDGTERVNGDVSLSTTVEAFQVEVTGERAEAVLMVYAKLIHMDSGKVYASNKFSHRVPAQSREVDAGVEALNQAMNELVAGLSSWVVRRARLRFRK